MDVSVLADFADPGPHSTAPRWKVVIQQAPTEIAKLANWVQARLLHEHWAPRYGETLTPEQRAVSHRRSVDDVLDRVAEMGPADRDLGRVPARPTVGVCSHFCLLGVSVLRAHSIPAIALRLWNVLRCWQSPLTTGGGGVNRRTLATGGLAYRCLSAHRPKAGLGHLDLPTERSCWPPRLGRLAGRRRRTILALSAVWEFEAARYAPRRWQNRSFLNPVAWRGCCQRSYEVLC